MTTLLGVSRRKTSPLFRLEDTGSTFRRTTRSLPLNWKSRVLHGTGQFSLLDVSLHTSGEREKKSNNNYTNAVVRKRSGRANCFADVVQRTNLLWFLSGLLSAVLRCNDDCTSIR